MIEIKSCGDFLYLDKDGHVESINTQAPLQDKWWPIVEEAIKFYKESLGDSLHSIYIRGSVAKGAASDFVSDLDSFAVSNSLILAEEPKELENFRIEMKRQYPFCLGVEISAIEISKMILPPPKRKRSIWEELIKTQSRCVYGEDLAKEIRPFKLEEMLGHSYYIIDEIEKQLPKYLETCKENPQDQKDNCTWIMKRILRSAYDLVMLREQKFTRDLYRCYESSAKYYPEKGPILKEALNLALNPHENYTQWMPLAQDLSLWIKRELSLGNQFNP